MVSPSVQSKLLLAWRVVLQLVMVCAIVTFIAGIVMFYDAPIAPRAGGFAGKWGTPHSEAHYRAFKLWETAIAVLWPAMFGLIALRAAFQPDWALTVQRKQRPSWRQFFK